MTVSDVVGIIAAALLALFWPRLNLVAMRRPWVPRSEWEAEKRRRSGGPSS